MNSDKFNIHKGCSCRHCRRGGSKKCKINQKTVKNATKRFRRHGRTINEDFVHQIQGRGYTD